MFYLIFALIGVSVTFVGAICGVGGGVILKPLLDALTDYSALQISLLCGVTVLFMSLASLVSSKDMRGTLRSRRTLLLALGAVVGGWLGKVMLKALLARAGNDALVGVVQNALLGLLTLGTLWYEMNRAKIDTHHLVQPWAVVGVSLALGLVSTFLGIGGGPFNMIVLMYCFSMDVQHAAASSLCIILFAQAMALIETIAFGQTIVLPHEVLAVGAASGVVGGLIGRAAARRMDGRQVDRLFMGLLLVIVFVCVGNIVKFAS